MREINYPFICESISNISGIPVRYYQNRQLVTFESMFPFPVDPVKLYLEEMLNIKKDVSYYITPYHMLFGILCRGEHHIILGPINNIAPSNQQLREYAFLLGITDKDFLPFRVSILSIPPLSLQNFKHLLALLHCHITDEIKDVTDITPSDFPDNISMQEISAKAGNKSAPSQVIVYQETHSTMSFETKMLALVEKGDTEGLKELINHVPPGNIGKTANTHLRQQKNMFIVTATLVSRAAIHSGMLQEYALSLSDTYIQKVETLYDTERILNLQFNMIMDYTSQIANIRDKKLNSKFVQEITSYIKNHISESIKIDEMAEEFFLSRSHLTTRFKQETGITLSNYIQEMKLNEAKWLLAHTDNSILDISNYLGFSSQSHFQNAFKKIAGMTPKQYREQS